MKEILEDVLGKLEAIKKRSNGQGYCKHLFLCCLVDSWDKDEFVEYLENNVKGIKLPDNYVAVRNRPRGTFKQEVKRVGYHDAKGCAIWEGDDYDSRHAWLVKHIKLNS